MLHMYPRSVIEEFERKGGIMYHLYLMENEESFGGQKLNADVSWKYVRKINLQMFNTEQRSKTTLSTSAKEHKQPFPKGLWNLFLFQVTSHIF